MPKKKPIKGKPKVNPELDGLEIKINEFGEIISNYDINEINKFLNRNVDDKKLRDRDDIGEDGSFMSESEMEPDDEKLFEDIDDEDMPEIDMEETDEEPFD